MRKLVVGILAHVDAGKTTLSEALLYQSGALRRLGRVDHQDAFLDTDAMERERGITIFSKQAVPPPGVHDHHPAGHPRPRGLLQRRWRRTLQVLDYAILVISGTDGSRATPSALWRLLSRYHIPDLSLYATRWTWRGPTGTPCWSSSGCASARAAWTSPPWRMRGREDAAVCDEGILEKYLETGALEDADVISLIRHRKVFPCWFGSALKLEGVAEFLEGVEQYAPRKCCPPQFGARVYKVARDAQGVRLTYLKITGGSLRVKTPLTGGEGEMRWEEKADQIRIYSGAKYRAVEEAEAGTVCAVTGLSRTRPGEGLGFEAAGQPPVLEPVLTYRLELPEGCDPHAALRQLRELEEEDPSSTSCGTSACGRSISSSWGRCSWRSSARSSPSGSAWRSLRRGEHRLPGDIAAPVEGVGHFEPLRHYAEVHLLLEPGERGSGLR